MTTLRQELSGLAWTDADQNLWRDRLRAAARDDDEVEYAAFVSPGIHPVNADALDDGALRRFMGEVDPGLAGLAAERASRYANAFTQAVLLDFAATDQPKSKENREAMRAAAHRYIDALEHFARGANPRDHVLAIGESVARAVDLLAVYGEPTDRLVGAVEYMVGKFKGTPDEEFIGGLAVALTRRHPRQRSTQVFAKLYATMKAAVDGMSTPLHRGRCALDLQRVAKLAGKGDDYHSWSPEVTGRAALSLAGVESPLVASGRLMGALLHAVDSGHEIRSELFDALETNKDDLLASGVDVQVARFSVPLADLAAHATSVLEANPLDERLRRLAEVVSLPARSAWQSAARLVHAGPMASLVTFVPIGDHGPTADSPDTLADHQALEMILLRDATVVGEVLAKITETTDLKAAFPPEDVASLLVQAEVLEPGQEPLFTSVWRAWTADEHGLALFGLFPFVEQAFRRACNRGIGLSRNRSIVASTGDSLTPRVRKVLGDDAGDVFAHLLAEEGAHRHAFAHGYARDSTNHAALANYCVYLLCYVFRYRPT